MHTHIRMYKQHGYMVTYLGTKIQFTASCWLWELPDALKILERGGREGRGGEGRRGEERGGEGRGEEGRGGEGRGGEGMGGEGKGERGGRRG